MLSLPINQEAFEVTRQMVQERICKTGFKNAFSVDNLDLLDIEMQWLLWYWLTTIIKPDDIVRLFNQQFPNRERRMTRLRYEKITDAWQKRYKQKDIKSFGDFVLEKPLSTGFYPCDHGGQYDPCTVFKRYVKTRHNDEIREMATSLYRSDFDTLLICERGCDEPILHAKVKRKQARSKAVQKMITEIRRNITYMLHWIAYYVIKLVTVVMVNLPEMAFRMIVWYSFVDFVCTQPDELPHLMGTLNLMCRTYCGLPLVIASVHVFLNNIVRLPRIVQRTVAADDMDRIARLVFAIDQVNVVAPILQVAIGALVALLVCCQFQLLEHWRGLFHEQHFDAHSDFQFLRSLLQGMSKNFVGKTHQWPSSLLDVNLMSQLQKLVALVKQMALDQSVGYSGVVPGKIHNISE